MQNPPFENSQSLPLQLVRPRRYSDSLLLWGASFWHSQGPLVKQEFVLTGITYTELVEAYLHPDLFTLIVCTRKLIQHLIMCWRHKFGSR